MTLTFRLNGTTVSYETPADKRLIDVLREDAGLTENRAGCYSGACGTCAVFLNGELTYSCLVPAFSAQDVEVITFEGLAGSADLEDILTGFEAAHYKPCANCFRGRVLSVYALLSTHPVPERKDIDELLYGHRCGCSSVSSLYEAVERSISLRRRRRHVRR